MAAGAGPRRVLYLSYDGLTDPLGESQILPYVLGLRARGFEFTLITCEKPDRFAVDGDRCRDLLRAAGIEWIALRYHRWPPVLSSVADMVQMARAARQALRRTPHHLIHARSYVSAAVGRRLAHRASAGLLFDMRGFWADERIDGGIWGRRGLRGAAYRWWKAEERRLLRASTRTLVLSDAARRELETWPDAEGFAPVQVVRTYVDLALFDPKRFPPERRAALRGELGLDPVAPIVTYLGSLGTWYPVDAIVRCFAAVRTQLPDAVLLVISRDGTDQVFRSASALGLPSTSIRVRAASRAEVPELVSLSTVGIALVTPSFSKIASFPTKIGELLAMGVPVITNGGVGDVAELIGEGAGILVEGFDDQSLGVAVSSLLERCPWSDDQLRRLAEQWCSLEAGLATYESVYRSCTDRQK